MIGARGLKRQARGVGVLLLAIVCSPVTALAQEVQAPSPPSMELPRDVRLRIQLKFETLFPLQQTAAIKTAMASELCDRDDLAPADWCDRMRREADEARAVYEAARQAYERRHADALAAARARPFWRELASFERAY